MSQEGPVKDGPVFSPELEGLLREVAADPGSSLLRVARPRVVAGYLDRSLVARDALRARTLAEQELLRLHREELALALREACLVRFYEGGDQAVLLHHHRSQAHPYDEHRWEAWNQRASAVHRAAILDRIDLPHMDLLQLVLQGGPGRKPTIVQLARASQSLVTSDVAECYEGLALVLEGNHLAGARLMVDLVEHRSTRRIASHAAENVGLAFGLCGDDARALPQYRRAWELNPSRVEPVIAWLVCSLTTNDEAQADLAARTLDGLCQGDHPAVRELVALKQAQRTRGMLMPSSTTRSLAVRLRETVGSASESVLDVLV